MVQVGTESTVDAERYRKLRAWIMHDYPTLGLGPTVIDARGKGTDTFDATVDALPEPTFQSEVRDIDIPHYLPLSLF